MVLNLFFVVEFRWQSFRRLCGGGGCCDGLWRSFSPCGGFSAVVAQAGGEAGGLWAAPPVQAKQGSRQETSLSPLPDPHPSTSGVTGCQSEE